MWASGARGGLGVVECEIVVRPSGFGEREGGGGGAGRAMMRLGALSLCSRVCSPLLAFPSPLSPSLSSTQNDQTPFPHPPAATLSRRPTQPPPRAAHPSHTSLCVAGAKQTQPLSPPARAAPDLTPGVGDPAPQNKQPWAEEATATARPATTSSRVRFDEARERAKHPSLLSVLNHRRRAGLAAAAAVAACCRCRRTVRTAAPVQPRAPFRSRAGRSQRRGCLAASPRRRPASGVGVGVGVGVAGRSAARTTLDDPVPQSNYTVSLTLPADNNRHQTPKQ